MNSFRLIGQIKKISNNTKKTKFILKSFTGKSSILNCYSYEQINIEIGDVIELTNYEPINITYISKITNEKHFYQSIEVYDFNKLNEIDISMLKNKNSLNSYEFDQNSESEEDLTNLEF